MRLLFLGAAFLLAWGPAILGTFHFDDHSMLRDPLVTSPEGWRNAFRPFQTRPLTELTFWLSYQLGGGTNPAAFLSWNVVLHALNAALAWMALRIALPQASVFAAVAIFALHPFQAEPVNYAFARSTLLMSAFCLATLLAWLKRRYLLATGLFALALLAKEECVTFPLFLLLLSLWQEGRRPSNRQIAAASGMLILALVAGLRTIAATAAIQGAGAGYAAAISPADYFRAQGVVILHYLQLLCLPFGFTVDPSAGIPSWIYGMLAWSFLAGIAIFTVWNPKARPHLWWFAAGLILLLPGSSIFPAEDLAADRRMYLPMLAFACLFVRIPAMPLLVTILAGLSFVRTTTVWRTEETLWREAVERSPGKVRPKIQLARASSIEEAKSLLDQAAGIDPANPDIPNELGLCLLRKGQAAEALGAFGRALALAPSDPNTINNRGVALFQLGQAEAARQDFQRALALQPCLADARRNLQLAGGNAPPGDCR